MAPKSGALAFRFCNPMKRNEKPNTNSPTDLRELLPEKKSGIPIASRGSAKAAISTLNPKAEIIQAVTVVPMFAPIITPIDWESVNSPAFTKLTTMTVVADEDWIRAVINTPVSIPVTLFVVIAVKIFRKLSPANFCNPSLMIFIPYRNRANDPMSRRKSKKE